MMDFIVLRDFVRKAAELGVLLDQHTPADLQAQLMFDRMKQDEINSRERDRRFRQMVEDARQRI